MKPELVGLQVVSTSNAPLGEVVDVVFDSQGQPDYVVIASEGNNAAVPFQAASSMIEGGKVIMDQSKLKQAPKLDQGEWREKGENASWKHDATQYWALGLGSGFWVLGSGFWVLGSEQKVARQS
jgi:hypothetical protein